MSDDDDVEIVRLLSLRQFIERASQEYDVRCLGVAVDDGEHGIDARWLIRRLDDGATCRVVVPDVPMDEPLPAPVLAWLCRNLRLRPHSFGLLIG